MEVLKRVAVGLSSRDVDLVIDKLIYPAFYQACAMSNCFIDDVAIKKLFESYKAEFDNKLQDGFEY